MNLEIQATFLYFFLKNSYVREHLSDYWCDINCDRFPVFHCWGRTPWTKTNIPVIVWYENRQKAYFGKISRKNFRILVDLHKNSNLLAMTWSLKMAIRKAIFQKHLKTYLLLNPWNWFDLFENFNDVVSVSKVDREMFTIFRPQLVARAGPHWSVANSWPAARSRVVLWNWKKCPVQIFWTCFPPTNWFSPLVLF